MSRKVKEVTLYATLSCPYCKMEKAWLDNKGVKHKLVFVDLNPYEAKKMVEKTGQMGVPVTEISFEQKNPEFVIGFDQHKLSEVLGVS